MKPHIFRLRCGLWAVRTAGRVVYSASFERACAYAKWKRVA